MSQATDQALHTLNEFMAAVMARKHDAIMAFFAEDAQMFSPLGVFPARLDGRAAIGKQFETILQTLMAQPIQIDPQDMVIRELAPNAVLFTFHLRLQGPLHRRSILLMKSGNDWRIAHIHASIASPT